MRVVRTHEQTGQHGRKGHPQDAKGQQQVCFRHGMDGSLISKRARRVFFAYVFFFFFFFFLLVFSKDEIHTQSLGATHAATKTRYLKM